ncbi:MAG: hypothetical protein ACJAZQ_001363 [Cognaticolwellia sp.]|jgi:hypothetical protein
MRKITKDSGCCKENTIVKNQNTVNNNSHLITPSHLQPVIFNTGLDEQPDKRTEVRRLKSCQIVAELSFIQNKYPR